MSRPLLYKHIVAMYEVRAKRWGMAFLRANHWKIKSLCDREDLAQEAFLAYLQICRNHVGKSEGELFKLFKVRMFFLVRDSSKSCFPNPYSCVKDVGQFVIDIYSERFKAVEDMVSVQNEVAACLDLLDKVPTELQAAFELLVRDLFSAPCIEQRVGKTLRGRKRYEPINMTLARLTNLDSGRDILGELELALNTDSNRR